MYILLCTSYYVRPIISIPFSKFMVAGSGSKNACMRLRESNTWITVRITILYTYWSIKRCSMKSFFSNERMSIHFYEYYFYVSAQWQLQQQMPYITILWKRDLIILHCVRWRDEIFCCTTVYYITSSYGVRKLNRSPSYNQTLKEQLFAPHWTLE